MPPETDFAALARATASLDAPFAVVDRAALVANADALVARAQGKPIRVASKSVRCRAVIEEVLERPGYDGVLALTLAEAVWLATTGGIDDVVVGYPSVDRSALRALASSDVARERVTIMVDDVAQLNLAAAEIDAAGGAAGVDRPPVRVCLDVDASLELFAGRVHLGPLRSPVHSVADVVALARAVVARPEFRLVGLMSYEGQIAGLGDDAGSRLTRLQVRGMQRASRVELRRRRASVVRAVREIAPLELVNGGGTGSLESTGSEPAVTEVAAGSGLFSPTLFDTYRGFRHRPAAYFALPVVRRPAADVVTVAGGGWIASGVTGADRAPTPVWPPGLSLTPREGAGEAQTPLRGEAAADLSIGDLVWFRHTKAGELCEHVNELHLVDGDRLERTVPTYRGEGYVFL